MDPNLPSAEKVRSALSGFSRSQLMLLADASGVPWTTLRKIRDGETENPGLETVRKFFPLIPSIAVPTEQGAGA